MPGQKDHKDIISESAKPHVPITSLSSFSFRDHLTSGRGAMILRLAWTFSCYRFILYSHFAECKTFAAP